MECPVYLKIPCQCIQCCIGATCCRSTVLFMYTVEWMLTLSLSTESISLLYMCMCAYEFGGRETPFEPSMCRRIYLYVDARIHSKNKLRRRFRPCFDHLMASFRVLDLFSWKCRYLIDHGNWSAFFRQTFDTPAHFIVIAKSTKCEKLFRNSFSQSKFNYCWMPYVSFGHRMREKTA